MVRMSHRVTRKKWVVIEGKFIKTFISSVDGTLPIMFFFLQIAREFGYGQDSLRFHDQSRQGPAGLCGS